MSLSSIKMSKMTFAVSFALLAIFYIQVIQCSLQKRTSPTVNVPGQQVREFVFINDKRYYIKLTSLTWLESSSECAALNMSLITFEEPDEYMTVLNGLQENGLDKFWYWTGAFRKANSTEWTWLTNDGDAITDFYWAPRQPTEDISEDTCINFNPTEGGWDDDYCDAVYYLSYICE